METLPAAQEVTMVGMTVPEVCAAIGADCTVLVPARRRVVITHLQTAEEPPAADEAGAEIQGHARSVPSAGIHEHARSVPSAGETGGLLVADSAHEATEALAKLSCSAGGRIEDAPASGVGVPRSPAGISAVVLCGQSLQGEERGRLRAAFDGTDLAVLVTLAPPARVLSALAPRLTAGAAAAVDQLTVMQRLLRAADADDPLASLTAAMAELSAGSALIFDDSLTLLHSSGAAPAHLISTHLASAHLSSAHHSTAAHRDAAGPRSIAAHRDAAGPRSIAAQHDAAAEDARAELRDGTDPARALFPIGRWMVAAQRIRVRAHDYHLVLASHDHATVRSGAALVFDTLAAILGSFGAIEGFARTQQTVSSAALLRELEYGISAAAEQRAWQKMGAFGFQPYSDLLLIICATASGAAFSLSDLDALLSAADRRGQRLPMLAIESSRLGEQAPGLRLLVPAGPGAEALICALGDSTIAGVSEPFSQLSALPDVARAAETALTVARRTAAVEPSAAVVRVDRLSPVEWLLAGATSVRDRSILAHYGAGLRARPELLTTLLAYFSAHLTINRAAEALRIHPNTLRYRLGRIEEVLGASLSDPRVIADLCLSFDAELTAAGLGRRADRQPSD